VKGDSSRGGVIWITGYSAAGKTTVGRRVEARLRKAGIKTVFLDGDDLRSIFSGQWGYSRKDRIDLAKIYFRLSSHLSAQGFVVVISAIAMFREVSEWVRENIPNSLQILLQTPENERLLRDSRTKNIYRLIENTNNLYDDPHFVDFAFANDGSVDPETCAARIVEKFNATEIRSTDFGRVSHWGDYYGRELAPDNPSPFAMAVQSELPAGSSIIEIGCGNGRDASFFARLGHSVTAIDLSEEAISLCRKRYPGITFESGRISELHSDRSFDVAYSRFVLHAMPLDEEIATLETTARLLRPSGVFYIECRSINDPLAREGEVISPTERISGHYRRFIILDELLERLKVAGFDVVSYVESNSLAVYKDEDPVVIRVTARRK